jgi:hypothetical protein
VKTYRASALASAFVRMWRGWSVIVPVVVVNALLQALLVWPDAVPSLDGAAVIYAALSAIVLLLAYGLVATTALHVADGRVDWATALTNLRANAARYVIGALLLGLVIAMGLAYYTIPGLVVLGLTPFVLLAAVDGQRNPLAANFRAIGRRFWRWLLTTLVLGVVVGWGVVLAGVTAFFVRGSLASMLVWLVAGLVLVWFTTAWALIYRSANAPSEVVADEDIPAGEATSAGGDLA